MDLPMLAAATLLAGTAAYGARVGAREEIAGEPFGWRLPGRVARHQAWGYGSGTMAPWPMPVAALAAAVRAGGGSEQPARVCLAIGSVCLIGTVVEPQTWGRRSTSRAATVATALHLLSGTALVLAGQRATLASRRSRSVVRA
ncbi:hypothetical protein E9549_03350 [Blastococcus sp. MG754426]|uniref:hypothetical protein n=1 Tax=unclassified Blastococcus TaxID=2619396 RepID=UPI001EEFAD75|nr:MULTISPECIES: hypothetical protein [unclassified Blastococcus]MCF6506447.1 hypothetical protein [Blastococcus sp. MG754426]MCF6511268.1 hypothetical protein [Blastococcus sp. MG754427]